jgi:regulator of replication initiation timing
MKGTVKMKNNLQDLNKELNYLKQINELLIDNTNLRLGRARSLINLCELQKEVNDLKSVLREYLEVASESRAHKKMISSALV